MGYTSYSTFDASLRSTKENYASRSTDDIFEQVKKRQIHELMNPKNVKLREARDSAAHPVTYPIIIALDVTGSMRDIPKYFISKALIDIVSKIMESGYQHPAIMIMAIGDAKSDNAPLQISQFESGDVELEAWLSRIWPEGNGGGNGGESYNLAWYFAAYHTATDSFEKRGKKGLLITIGDEPVHGELSFRSMQEIFGEGETTLTNEQLLEDVQKTYDVYHMHINEGSHARHPLAGWRHLLGENCLEIENYTKVPNKIADIVIEKTKDLVSGTPIQPGIVNAPDATPVENPVEML